MRKLLVYVLVVAVLGLVGWGYWLWRQQQSMPIRSEARTDAAVNTVTGITVNNHRLEAASEAKGYGLRLADSQLWEAYLGQHGIWQMDGFDIPNGSHIVGPVTGVKVVYTQQEQPYNQETGAKGLVGSVNVASDNGILVITVESLPVVWDEVDKSLHIDAQVARIVNDIGSKDSQVSLDEVLNTVGSQPRMFEVYAE